MIDISVIIPTYNRSNVLRKTMDAILHQTYPADKYEVIVIDDGSKDDTVKMLKKHYRENNVKIFANEINNGRSKTRNFGINKAIGSLALMIDDDVIASSGLIERHVKEHQGKADICVVGAILPSPEIKLTAINEYLNNHHLWCYNEMKSIKNELSYNFFKTANVSLSKNLLVRTGLFNEQFSFYGGEDTELGLRLKKNGVKMIFSLDAVGYHFHDENVRSFTSKAVEQGRSLSLYFKLAEKKPDSHYVLFPDYAPIASFMDIMKNLFKLVILNYLARNMNYLMVFCCDNVSFAPVRNILLQYLIPTLKTQYQRIGYK